MKTSSKHFRQVVGKLAVLCLCVALVTIHAASAALLVIELKGHTPRVDFVAFSPDGKKIVTAGGVALSNNDKTARL